MPKKNTQPEEPIEPAEQAEPAEPGPQPDSRERLRELNDRLLRVTADFQNYQKRMGRELAEVRERTQADLLAEFLAVVDDLERAMEASAQSPDAPAIAEGVRITHEHLMSLLARHGVTPIEAVGRPFDPQFHEAMMREPTADAEPMTVTRQMTRGYVMGGRPLRPARVAVAVAPEPVQPDDGGSDDADL